MTLDSPWLLPLLGLLCGIALGAVARYYRFCTLTALERYWYADDSTGLRAWILAAAVAISLTQAAIFLEFISLEDSFYLVPRLSLLGIVLGGVLFGIGMAFVGTCGFGALVRIGGGSLQSLVVVVGIGLAALSTQRGVLSNIREAYIEPYAIDLSNFGSQAFPTLISHLTGLPLYWPIVCLVVFTLFYWIFKDPLFRKNNTGIFSGLFIGLCVAFGWFATFGLSHYLYEPVQLESASFVLPPGQFVQSLITRDAPIPDYGVGMVLGVVVGALVVALCQGDIRWEACDDARELRRHLTGAILMGVGGVLAGGCTLGQGVSGMSVLALSAPIVFLSICMGARLGLSWLVEGSLISFFRLKQ